MADKIHKIYNYGIQPIVICFKQGSSVADSQVDFNTADEYTIQSNSYIEINDPDASLLGRIWLSDSYNYMCGVLGEDHFTALVQSENMGQITCTISAPTDIYLSEKISISNYLPNADLILSNSVAGGGLVEGHYCIFGQNNICNISFSGSIEPSLRVQNATASVNNSVLTLSNPSYLGIVLSIVPTDLTGWKWIGSTNIDLASFPYKRVENENIYHFNVEFYNILQTGENDFHNTIGTNYNEQTPVSLAFLYDTTTVYSNGQWVNRYPGGAIDANFKTIIFISGEDLEQTSFISWLDTNGRLIPPKYQIDNLVGYTWIGKTTVDLSPNFIKNISFISNYESFSSFTVSSGAIINNNYIPAGVLYDNINLYDDLNHWRNPKYRTIKFYDGMDVTNAELIQWLEDNGAFIQPQPQPTITDLTDYRWDGRNVIPAIWTDTVTYNVNFTSNENSFSSITFEYSSTYGTRILYYDDLVIFSGTGYWTDNTYKTINFINGEDITNASLITWMQQNGVLEVPRPSEPYSKIGDYDMDDGFIGTDPIDEIYLGSERIWYRDVTPDGELLAVCTEDWVVTYNDDFVELSDIGTLAPPSSLEAFEDVITFNNADYATGYDIYLDSVLFNSFNIYQVDGESTNCTINGSNTYSNVIAQGDSITLTLEADGESYRLPQSLNIPNSVYTRESDTYGTLVITVLNNLDFEVSAERISTGYSVVLTIYGSPQQGGYAYWSFDNGETWENNDPGQETVNLTHVFQIKLKSTGDTYSSIVSTTLNLNLVGGSSVESDNIILEDDVTDIVMSGNY